MAEARNTPPPDALQTAYALAGHAAAGRTADVGALATSLTDSERPWVILALAEVAGHLAQSACRFAGGTGADADTMLFTVATTLAKDAADD